MKIAALVLAAVMATLSMGDAPARQRQLAPAGGARDLEGKKLGWIFNNDNSSSWEALSGGETTHEEFRNIVRQMLDTQPGLFVQCAGCIDPVCYPSRFATWGEKAERYDLEVRRKANTSDVHIGTKQEEIRRSNVLKRFREPGKDSISLTIEVCRERRIPVVISFRMSEGGSYHATLDRADFSRTHKYATMARQLPNGELQVPGLGTLKGGQGWGLDRAVPEVYDHQMSIFKEAVEKFDVDGIEFDFKRYYPMISNPYINHPIHTRLVRELREYLDGVAKKRRRGRMLLGVRVSYSIEGPMDPGLGVPGVDFNCKDLGLDVRTWIREGYVDYVCPSYFHGLDLPGLPNVREFAGLARGTKVGVYPSTFARPRWPEKEQHPDNASSWQRLRDEICRDALQMYAEGADGVSTFNMNPGDYRMPLVYPPKHVVEPGPAFRRGSASYNRVVAEVMRRLGDPSALRDFMHRGLDFMTN